MDIFRAARPLRLFNRIRPLSISQTLGNGLSISIYNHPWISHSRFFSGRSPPNPPAGPLTGIRILDFTRVLAGPFCTQILADYGADVIKVESPKTGDGTRAWQAPGEASIWKQPSTGPMSFFFAAINRNKRSIELDLKSEKGKEAVRRLVRDGGIDVVIENFIPGTAERLGIGWNDLRDLNGRLIYVSLSGYGNSGPYARRAGYDAIAAAESAFMGLTGHPGQPPVRAPLGMTDMATGLYAHGAIMSGLYSREQTGRGQHISASLFETQISMLVNVGVNWLNRGVKSERYGAAHPSAVPYNAYLCSNDLYMVIAANSEPQYRILCKALSRSDLIDDPRFQTNALRIQNRKEMDQILSEIFITKDSDSWLKVFDGSGLAHGPVNTIERAFEHPQIAGRDMVLSLEWDALMEGKWKGIGPAVKFSETPAGVRRMPPKLGEHNEEVLREAGYNEEELTKMRDA